ncbi:putative secreted protein [Wickerhamomyces ciferrii]|uniref:Carboxypeptidase n=1 Tax=Wickerhamomyces ciferrii (strain ATCC 14091 / BCRC 22168 / CBS 111 / JCM 3599 / NBRC 0793 / NRRL Y-1031 F-60-10) TaxID=1206466 RepID=K0KGR8_WICCF|nr:uncharacterized protein BN7_3923 [Wickerhamomyces ciferrii]CCH44360.1 putative secreted protein [Wickerhamomyces ciferrii]
MVLISSFGTFLGLLISLVSTSPIDIPSKKFLVENLPGIESVDEIDRPLMYAGHLELNPKIEENYFFWKFLKKNYEFNKTIIWLNGGPGCSSMDGALMEIGPLHVRQDGDLKYNTGSWNEVADLVFVDQPGGTGFSTTKDYDKDLNKVGDDFVVFLQKYYEVFPEDLNKELYIAGESYAGQYIPFIADKILNSNESFSSNLKGLLIGNGWIAPIIQSLSYIPFMLDKGLLNPNDEFMPKLLKQQEHCQNLVNNPVNDDKFEMRECENILTWILQYTRDKKGPKDQECLNMYDIKLRDSYPSCGMNWPPDLEQVGPYLHKKEVVQALNLDPSKIKQWRECDGDVSKYLKNKGMKPSYNLLPSLLSKLEIMLFNGGNDIICNNRGVEDLISKLNWGGSKGFSDEVETYDWIYDDQLTGSIKSSKNLTYVDVFNASHMIPFDLPEQSRGIFDLFVKNFKFQDQDGKQYIETPIHHKDTPTQDNNENENQDSENSKGKSPIFFIFYLIFFLILGGLVVYYKKRKQPKKTSILRNKNLNDNNNNNINSRNGHKKTVSWADSNDDRISPTSTPPPTYQRTQAEPSRSNRLNNFINSFNRGDSSNGQYKKVYNTEDLEDIELQSNVHKKSLDDDEFDIDNELDNDYDLGTSSKSTSQHKE